MKNHPEQGYILAKKIGITSDKILSGIRHHHEKSDGSGYPDKLISEEINLFPKIIAICDVFDALSTRSHIKNP
ncbi:MAG: HD domain-containing protein [Helicobacteraceae bacterium]|nr:HD domain-containing protein [Helicobacteraceae bacterium]